MDLKQLQHFIHIAELGSLTRAAGLLGVTQAALSRQMAQLEAELETELFKRNGRGVTLTDSGKKLEEHASAILKQVQKAQRAVKGGGKGAAQGHMVLGLPPSLSRNIVVPLVEAFQQRLPDATMTTIEGLSSSMMDLLTIGKLDCAIVYNRNATEGVDLMPLADEDLYLVSGSMAISTGQKLGAAIALTDIADLHIISAGRLNAVHTAFATALTEIGKTPNVVHEIANLPAILDLVRKGYGYTVAPLSAVHSCVGDPELRLHRICKPVLHCTLSIATPTQVKPDALTMDTISVLRDVVLKQLAGFREDVEGAIDGKPVKVAGKAKNS
ncbi:pca operon transcription factor [compost metagenome]